MKVTVDPIMCEANAICVRLVPRVFSIHEDDDGEDVLAIASDGEVSPELADGVRDAVGRCPKMALTLEDLATARFSWLMSLWSRAGSVRG